MTVGSMRLPKLKIINLNNLTPLRPLRIRCCRPKKFGFWLLPAEPLATFDTVARAVQARLPAGQTLEHCVANSAALFTLPQAYRAWARPGIALYGASPFAGQSAASLGLRPAMQLTGNVLGV